MRDARVLILAGALLVAACGRDVPEAREDAESPPAPQAAVAPRDAAATIYTCANGDTVQASYPDAKTVVVSHQGDTFNLTRVESEIGAVYEGQGRQWRSQNGGGASDEGTLRFTQADSALAGALIAECSTNRGVQAQP